jgi:hypothetical protein
LRVADIAEKQKQHRILGAIAKRLQGTTDPLRAPSWAIQWGYISVKPVKFRKPDYDDYVAGLELLRLVKRNDSIRPTTEQQAEMKRAGIGAGKVKAAALKKPPTVVVAPRPGKAIANAGAVTQGTQGTDPAGRKRTPPCNTDKKLSARLAERDEDQQQEEREMEEIYTHIDENVEMKGRKNWMQRQTEEDTHDCCKCHKAGSLGYCLQRAVQPRELWNAGRAGRRRAAGTKEFT